MSRASHPLLLLFGSMKLSVERGLNLCQDLGLISDNVIAAGPTHDGELPAIAPESHWTPPEFRDPERFTLNPKAKPEKRVPPATAPYNNFHFARLEEVAKPDVCRVLDYFNAWWAAPEEYGL